MVRSFMERPVSNAILGTCLTIHDVVSATSLSRATIYRMIKRSQFPDRVRLSENRVGWSEKAIRDWLAKRTAEPPI